MSLSTKNKRKITNLFGGLGYLSILFQWLFVAILTLPVFLASDAYKNTLEPTPSQQPVAEPAALSGGIWVFVALIIALIFIVLTVVLLMRIPTSIAKTGHSVTTKSAQAVAPVIIRSRKLKPSEQTKLTARLVKLIKLGLVLLPVALVSLTSFINSPLDIYAASLIASLLAILSLLLFSTQYILARFLKLQSKDLL